MSSFVLTCVPDERPHLSAGSTEDLAGGAGQMNLSRVPTTPPAFPGWPKYIIYCGTEGSAISYSASALYPSVFDYIMTGDKVM